VSPNDVFHYAPWIRLPDIAESGRLMPSNAGGAPHEPPLLWFSSNPVWEPTANKSIMVNGTSHEMTFEQQQQTIGCIRFRLPASDRRLMGWEAACSFAGIPPRERQALEIAGQQRGASHEHWFAVAEPVPLHEVQLEVLLDQWHRGNPAEMARAWSEVWVKRL
jgi:hypothetical protein